MDVYGCTISKHMTRDMLVTAHERMCYGHCSS